MDNGSLLRLFQSEYFDSWICCAYLYKYGERPGVQDYLCNKLFKLPDVDVEFYLPQLVSLLCNRKPFSNSLERFVLDRCRRSMHLAFKFFWYISSYVEDDDPWNREYVRHLKSACEEAVVNGATAADMYLASHGEGSSESTHQAEGGDADDAVSEALANKLHSAALEKVERSEYFCRVTGLVDRLMRVSGSLRQVPIDERPKQLQERLGAAWNALGSANAYLPLWPANSRHFKIVRLPPGEGVVLNSRDRVPYMLFCEVIHSPLTSSSTPNLHSTLVQEDIAKLMKKMEQQQPDPSQPDEEKSTQRDLQQLRRSATLGPSSASAAAAGATLPQPESWDERKQRIKKSSPHSNDENWDVLSVIVKYGDDCRQELLAVQLLAQMKRIYEEASLPLWLHPHGILVVGKGSALIETIPNVKSIHQLKKANPSNPHISALFAQWFGDSSSSAYQLALRNFVESLAGYSIACYLLQVKDRHNGNILLDTDGHIIHIDFGFLLGQSPGGLSFEKAPFKLVPEWISLIGGIEGDLFQYFKALLVKGLLELQKHSEKIVVLVEMMIAGRGKGAGRQQISCLQDGPAVVAALRSRFEYGKTEEDVVKTVVNMVNLAMNATTTGMYDQFQWMQNRIEYLSEPTKK